MKRCLICDTEFRPRRNAKTCSPECSKKHTAKRQRAYHEAHPEARRIAQLRFTEVMRRITINRKIDRAVHLLFRMTHP